SKGICGCQMDIKIDGLPYEQLEKALAQAKAGRLHILGKMNETISKPNPDLKPHAPRMIEIIIDKSFIGAVIGPGGSIIQDLQEKTGTVITIEEKEGKGFVNISSSDKAGIDAAVARIRQISFQPEIGDVYDAVVKEILSFGAVVDFSGKQGLLHISEISHQRIANVEDVLKVGDHISIKLLDIDRKTGKFKLSAKVLQPKPERPPHQDRGDNRNRR
ncbi:MAG TPA: S1 RNA-binding domain-containing protein, partial [Saprospiraceae bacterium]|nr:S1 RNA-binding domain-containing protein [Saprospiraceae bacterium]